MIIKNAKTIQEYKQIRNEKIQKWIDANFESGNVTWELVSPEEIKVTDKTGDSMTIHLTEIR